MQRILCRRGDIAWNQARGFSVESGDDSAEGLELLLVDREGRLYAYVNSCPHIGAPLDWVPEQFLDHSGEYIQCSNHMALFEITTGLCVSGPCRGEKLTALQVEVDGDQVILKT